MSAAPPGDARALWESAQALVRRRALPEAEIALQRVVALQPAQVAARLLLASVVLARGRVRAAAAQLRAAGGMLGDDADMAARVAQALAKVGETVAARDLLRLPLVAHTRNARALAGLAHVHQGLGEHAEALALMDRAFALGFDNADFRYFRAIQLQFNGRLAEAERELEACLRLGPTYGRASVTLARLRRWSAEENHLDFIERRSREVAPGTEDAGGFEFARYKELEDLGRDGEAWDALVRANAIMAGRLGHDVAAEAALFDAIVAATPPDAGASPAQPFDGPQPIFIVGMPRSGTTLLERILGNHPQVMPAGELPDFSRQWRWVADQRGHGLVDAALLDALPRTDLSEVGARYLAQTQWRAQGKPFFVDKLPPNYLLCGVIRRALPQARILHMVRDPMDLCFSNWRALFGDSFGYSYDLDGLAAHHRHYSRLMAHWHATMPGVVHDVDYLRLATDTEAEARALLAYCGLPYDPACLDTAANPAPVATLSSAQVREPIRARRGEWRRYEAQFAPFAARLAEP